jgi:hypothetical protein
METMRKVQLVIGPALIAGAALAYFASEWFLIIPAFIGAGLIQAGITGICPMEKIIERIS